MLHINLTYLAIPPCLYNSTIHTKRLDINQTSNEMKLVLNTQKV